MARMEFHDLDGAFADAESDDRDEINVPDGIYLALVKGADFVWTKARTPERIFEWTLSIADGPYIEATVVKTQFLRPEGLKWFKIDLKRCGWKAESLTEVYNGKERLLGLYLEIKLETKNGRQNVYFRKRIEQEPNEQRATSNEPPPPGDDDEPPF